MAGRAASRRIIANEFAHETSRDRIAWHGRNDIQNCIRRGRSGVDETLITSENRRTLVPFQVVPIIF